MLDRKIIFLLGVLFVNHSLCAQEWKNLKAYNREMGSTLLTKGCWLKEDRKKNTERWKKANSFNLQDSLGFKKYKSVSEIRDFYIWFDEVRKKKGDEIEWVGYAAIASKQLSKIDIDIIRFLVVRNKEIVAFIKAGSFRVLEFSFPLLKEVYNSPIRIQNDQALQWDIDYGRIEQCEIIEPLYHELSPKALKKLNRMAGGKGIYAFGVPKEIRFEGTIENCENRVEHIELKIKPFYKSNSNSQSP